MIAELKNLLEAAKGQTAAAQATTAATSKVVDRMESANAWLASILADARAGRDLDNLYRVAGQLPEVAVLRQEVRTAYEQHNPVPWRSLQDAQRLLAATLEGVPPDALSKCRELVTADPRYTATLDDDAGLEIKQAITDARTRLAELTARSKPAPNA